MDDPQRIASERLYESAAAVAKALASAPRLRVMNIVAQMPRHVDQIAERMQQSRATTSAQLKVLASAGLVVGERDGQRVIYRPASDAALAMFLALREHVAEHDPATREACKSRDVAPIYAGTLDALESEVARGVITLLDLRPEEEWRHAHLRGARSVPYETLDAARFAKSGRYVAYCAGPTCAKAIDGSAFMSGKGLRVERLRLDVPAARVAGAQLESVAS